MPRKHRNTKGQKPRVNKTSRKETTIEQRVAMVAKSDFLAVKEVSENMDIPHDTVKRVIAKARNHARENRLPLTDRSNYEDKPHTGQPKKLTTEQEDWICNWITKEDTDHRDLLPEQIISKLNLDISESTLQQLMYDRGYSRKRCGWKNNLSSPVKRHRVSWASKWGPVVKSPNGK